MSTKSDLKVGIILFFGAAIVTGITGFFLFSGVLKLPPRIYKNPAMCGKAVMSPFDTCNDTINGLPSGTSSSYQEELDAANPNPGPPLIQFGFITITVGSIIVVLGVLFMISCIFLALPSLFFIHWLVVYHRKKHPRPPNTIYYGGPKSQDSFWSNNSRLPRI